MTAKLLLLLSVSAAPHQSETSQLIDPLQYRTAAVANKQWIAHAGTPALQIGTHDQRLALIVPTPFASRPKLQRSVMDREIKLDLSHASEFLLEAALPHETNYNRISLYFQSGNGWFSGSAIIKQGRWQQLTFKKQDFQTEGIPKGWADISRIRIAIWPPTGQANRDSQVYLRNLTANWNQIAIVLPDSNEGVWKTSYAVANRLDKHFVELGLQADRFTETEIKAGLLKKRVIAILPYNRPDAAAIEKLKQFVNTQGKLFVCYGIPGPLREPLGFQQDEYYKPAYDDPKLSKILFSKADQKIKGLPNLVKQASWNISTVKPSGHNARLLGEWYDENGKPTGKAAAAISDRGAYFSHIILDDDAENKKRLLMALLGELHPPILQQVMQHAINEANTIAGFNFASIRQQLEKNSRSKNSLEQSDDLLNSSYHAYQQSDNFNLALYLANGAKQWRIEVYCQAQPSPKIEGRAFWEHAGTGAYPGDWDKTCKNLKTAGFNMIISNMCDGSQAHYNSEFLEPSATFARLGDQIMQAAAAAKKHGIELHIWKVNHKLAPRTSEKLLTQLRQQGRLQQDVEGNETLWLNPAHPANFELERDSMLEIVRKYDVAGIHFDYIRYPNSQNDFSPYSRKKFEQQTGNKVNNWPQDCYSGSLKQAYTDWRADQITRLVKAVATEARTIKPGIKISAAVFRDYPSCRNTVAQDWPLWVKQGYLDFLSPMDYTGDFDQFRNWIEQQKKLVDGRIPIYPGIGAVSSRTNLTAAEVVRQISITRDLKTGGFTVFNLNAETAKRILPMIYSGVGRNPAKPPHNTVN